MKGWIFYFAIITLFASPALGDSENDSDVVVLTTSNFEDILRSNENVLVKFYAPWCGHCMKMAPEYAKAAKTLKEKNSKVVIAKVDAVAETALADQYKIGEFPTIFFFRNQNKEKYTGGRTGDQIVEWIEKMTGPAVIDSTSEVMEKELSNDNPFACMFEGDSFDNEAYKMYEKVANESRQTGKFYRQTGSSVSMFCTRFEEGKISYTKDVKSAAEFKAFVQDESFPLFGPIHGENFWKYNDREEPLAWFCGSEKDFNEYKSSIREASKEFRNSYFFVWLDTEQYRGHAEGALGITSFPGFALQKKLSRFVIPDAKVALKDAKKIVEFIQNVDAGKVEKDLKSEPIPSDPIHEGVQVIVGKTFQDLVVDAEKDVFLEIYSPWCVYCKNFEPVYKQFAESVQKFPHVRVAKMDGTANESPLDEFSWNSFPTIFFIKAGEKTPMKFEGARTVEGLREFLDANTSKPLSASSHDEL